MSKWIQKAIKKSGSLTRKAKASGMSVAEFSSAVSSNPSKYSAKTKRQVNLARTLSKLRKKKGK